MYMPAEFEEEHGTQDFDDKPELDDADADDLELDMTEGKTAVWLVKVPKFLLERWSQPGDEGVPLGHVRVFDPIEPEGKQTISVILDDTDHVGPDGRLPPTAVPLEYRMTMQNMNSKNLFVFGDKPEDVKETQDDDDDDEEEDHRKRKRRRVTKLTGTVNHECQLTPSLKTPRDHEAYSTQMRSRQRKAAAPARTIKRLDNLDQGQQNRMASGASIHTGIKSRISTNLIAVKPSAQAGEGRAARLPKAEILNILFARFEEKPYWSTKALAELTRQPQAYIRELLEEIGSQVQHGPYKNLWTLNDAHKAAIKTDEDQKPKPEEEDDDDDEAEMEEVQ